MANGEKCGLQLIVLPSGVEQSMSQLSLSHLRVFDVDDVCRQLRRITRRIFAPFVADIFSADYWFKYRLRLRVRFYAQLMSWTTKITFESNKFFCL
jgi:hypothetical protein